MSLLGPVLRYTTDEASAAIGPVPDSGYILLLDDDGAFLIDDDGSYFQELI